MPNDYLSVLWGLWKDNIITPNQVIEALNLYGYNLDYITKSGLKASKPGETHEFKYGPALSYEQS